MASERHAADSTTVATHQAALAPPCILVNVFTGFLGAGKTTIIMNLLKAVSDDADPTRYKVAWLKNEFGDNAIDSQLAKEKNVDVREILNGCLCCTLVGRLGDGLLELAKQYQPHRIFVETSGSAFPAPIAWEIKRLHEAGHPIKLDSIVCVIDVLNFKGYQDKSYTAKIQAKYTDLILLNKCELVSESHLEKVLDDVYEINPDTPKLRTTKGLISANAVLGIDTRLFELTSAAFAKYQQAVDAAVHGVCAQSDHKHSHTHGSTCNECDLCFDLQHASAQPEVQVSHWNERDLITHTRTDDLESSVATPGQGHSRHRLLDSVKVCKWLHSLDPSRFYRVKGFLWLDLRPEYEAASSAQPASEPALVSSQLGHQVSNLAAAVQSVGQPWLVNYAFGRCDFQLLHQYDGPSRLTFIGDRVDDGDVIASYRTALSECMSSCMPS